MVPGTDCSSRGPGFNPSAHMAAHNCLQLQFQEHLLPSYGLCRHQARKWCPSIHAGKKLTYIKINKFFKGEGLASKAKTF